MRKILILLTFILLFTSAYLLKIFIISPRVIKSELNKLCEQNVTPSNLAEFSCKEIKNVYVKTEFVEFGKYKICANYIDEDNNEFSIYANKDIGLFSSHYKSFAQNLRYKCTELNL